MFLLFLRDIICQSKDIYEDTELFLTELRPKFIMALKGFDKRKVALSNLLPVGKKEHHSMAFV